MAKKSKFIVDEERKIYLKRLAELEQKINPKIMSRTEIERMKKERLAMRENG